MPHLLQKMPNVSFSPPNMCLDYMNNLGLSFRKLGATSVKIKVNYFAAEAVSSGMPNVLEKIPNIFISLPKMLFTIII